MKTLIIFSIQTKKIINNKNAIQITIKIAIKIITISKTIIPRKVTSRISDHTKRTRSMSDSENDET